MDKIKLLDKVCITSILISYYCKVRECVDRRCINVYCDMIESYIILLPFER